MSSSTPTLTVLDIKQCLNKVGAADGAQPSKPSKRLPTITGKFELCPIQLSFPRNHWRYASRVNQLSAVENTINKVLSVNIKSDISECLVLNLYDGSISGVMNIQ